MSDVEQPLTGGNATAGVVRVGDTVRKPWHPNSAAVAEYVGRLAAAGIDVPRMLGRDGRGRQTIEYIAGEMADARPPLSLDGLERVGALIRSIHEASAPLEVDGERWGRMLLPAAEPDLICHNDLTPWNLVTGDRWVFIDWDGAGPSTRLWDLAYSAQAFAMLAPGESVGPAIERLRRFLDGYGADDVLRTALPATMAQRAAAMRDMLARAHGAGDEPWASMHASGHGAYWAGVARHLAEHRDGIARAIGPG